MRRARSPGPRSFARLREWMSPPAQPAERVVRALTLIAVTDEILTRAAHLEPPLLRTLDAVHLATALSLAEALGPIVTYDLRLADAARAAGIAVLAPS